MTYYSDLDGLSLSELAERFYLPPPAPEDVEAGYYDEIAFRIQQHGTAGFAFLMGELPRVSDDTPRVQALLTGLWWLSPQTKGKGAYELFLPYLRDPRPLVVATAIEGVRLLDLHVAHDAVLATLAAHTHVQTDAFRYVRCSALKYMSDLYPNEALPLLLATLHDSEPWMRACALDAIDDFAVMAALPAARSLLGDPDVSVRRVAETTVRNLEDLARSGDPEG
jgi:HEAT repeat protein